MNVVNIGIDKTLVGGKKLGDAIGRHRKYGEFLDHLDIIVYANKKEGLKEFKIADNVVGYPTNSLSKLFFCRDAKKIFEEINNNHKVDLIQCQDPFVALVGVRLKKKYGCKLQINFHGDFWDNPNWLKERWINIFLLWVSKYTVPKADSIRVMSSGQRTKLISAGIDEKKVRVISTPVDLKKYQGDVDDQKKEKKIVMHVGRDDEVKDYETLVRAFKLVKTGVNNVEFRQFGAGEKIKSAMKKNNFEQIKVMGSKSAVELVGFYQESDIFVLSSTSESFGKVLVEANACSKPVVSTATTGAKEIIQDGFNGYLVPVGDAQILADKIIGLLNDSEKAKIMGENGCKLVQEKYGDNTKKIIQFWNDIINLPS